MGARGGRLKAKGGGEAEPCQRERGGEKGGDRAVH